MNGSAEDPKDLETQDEARPHAEPHGIVEEIREELHEVVEEIHEAVEHVPPPVRWTVRKLAALILISFVGLIVIALISIAAYFAHRTELVAQELTLFVNHTLATRSDVRVEFRDVRGNPFQRVRLIGPRVVFAREGGTPLLEAPWIELGYSPFAWMRGKGRVEIIVESPTVRVVRTADGHLRLPTWKTSGTPGKPRTFDVHLVLRNGTVLLPTPLGAVRGLSADALVSTGTQTQVVIPHAGWVSGPYETHDLALSAIVSAGDSVRLTIQRLTTPDLAFAGHTEWRKGSGERRVHLDVERLSWRWLAKVTGNRTFDVPGEAQATIDGLGDRRWQGRFDSHLAWNDLPMTGDGGFTWDSGRLNVQPLHARSAAGELGGRASWSRAGWEVAGAVAHGEPSQWKAINITGWPKGDLNGAFRYSADTRTGVSNGSLSADLTASELAGWRVDVATVEAELPARGPRPFTVDAQRRGGTFHLDGTTTPTGWSGTYAVQELPLDEWPDGRASGIHGILQQGAGTVDARDGGLYVTGDLAGRRTDWLGLTAEGWRLDGVSGRLLPTPDLGSLARLRGVMFLGIHFDSVASGARLGDQVLGLGGLQAYAGDSLVRVDGTVSWDHATWRASLSHAEAHSSQFHWLADPPIDLSGDAEGVTFERLEASDQDAHMTVQGRWAVPGGSYSWQGRIQGLDLARIGLPPEWGLAGRADVRLDVHGRAGDPRWEFEGQAHQPAWSGHRGDSLALSLAGAPSTLDVRASTFLLDDGMLRAHGRFERTEKPWPDSLTGAAVMRWLAGAQGWSGAARADNFPVRRLEAVSAGFKDWSGQMSGDVTFGGRPRAPEFQVKGGAKPLNWREFSIPELTVAARYDDHWLDVSELRVVRENLTSTAHFVIPIDLSFEAPPKVRDEPLEGAIDVRNGDLAILPRLVPMLGSASGRFEMSAEIAGTGTKPDVHGLVRVSGGAFRVAGRSEVFSDVQAGIRLDGSTLRVDTLTAKQGEHGRVSVHGSAVLKSFVPESYRFEVSAREMTFSDPGIYAVQADGDFVVTPGGPVHGQPVPMVTGRATVRRAVILFDFAKQTEDQQLAASNQPLYWLYRIDLDAKSGIHWQPADADIEFNADMTAEQTASELRLFGEMHALRGTYYFLSNRFTVQQADLTFDNVSGVNPMMDAVATTQVVPSTSRGPIEGASANRDRLHEVTVHITGRAREPDIAFSSDPSDWDEPEILRQLTVGRFVTNGASASADPFDNYLTRAINRTLSDEMSRAFNGYLSEWQLDREQGGLFAGQGEVILGVGSQITPNLMLRYRQRVPGLGRPVSAADQNAPSLNPFERDIEAEYRLTRFFFVTSEYTQRRILSGTPSTSTEHDFNLNLKARWEY